MQIARVQITNFRNFRKIDVTLGLHAVIVGENHIGKSNFLYALRLVLDPALPDSARQLREEDFWDGLPRPLSGGDRIQISVDLTGFEENKSQLALLGDYLVEAETMTARLTYEFAQAGSPQDDGAGYEFALYGGDERDALVHSQVRRRLPLDVLHALRDAEGDLANWRRSPLRALLEHAAAQLPEGSLTGIAQQVTEVTEQLTSLPPIAELANRISARLQGIVGPQQANLLQLGFAPADASRLVRALLLLIDGGRRRISDASLGTANLIYLSLKLLELEQLVRQGQREHTFLAIEEPEAHLHPHLQRLVFRHFLRLAEEGQITNLLLTTHSPHLASVAPLRSLVVLKATRKCTSTKAVSTAQLDLSLEDEKDLERYLDVTRGEIVFARGVLLVEGDAELFLVPKLAQLNGYDFDELGITVCSVGGTNFLPYRKFLGENGLDVPHAIVTDYDPREDGLESWGIKRVRKLLEAAGLRLEDFAGDEKAVAARHGIFLNDHTFEVDLFRANRHRSICRALRRLAENRLRARQRATAWSEDPATLDEERYLADIERIGKGALCPTPGHHHWGQRLPSVHPRRH